MYTTTFPYIYICYFPTYRVLIVASAHVILKMKFKILFTIQISTI